MSVRDTPRRRWRWVVAIVAIAVVCATGFGRLFISDMASEEQASSPSAAVSSTQTSQPSAAAPLGEPTRGPRPKAIEYQVLDGKTVWETISAHVRVYFPQRSHSEQEAEVLDLVEALQQHIDVDPKQTVRDVNRVPANYRFYLSDDSSGMISPAPA